ncbi:MAG: methylenetetrahydrofolate reductase [Acidimicrobiales bacterium]
MTGHPAPPPEAWAAAGVAPLLARARFEVIPLRGVEEEVAHLPPGRTVTVTCSPRQGIEATVALAERLAERPFRVVPHLAARLVRGSSHLRQIADRLEAAGVQDVFVIGGDPPEPVGPYASAGSLLHALAERGHRFRHVGIAGYPERHPFVGRDDLYAALLDKQPFATYIVTQICFDPTAIFWWLAQIRERGIQLPVSIGLPGAVSRRRLLEVALKIGVGDSLRYLTKHGHVVARLGRGSFRPDGFLARLSPYLEEPGHNLQAFHLNTFNQVRSTERWCRRALTIYTRPVALVEAGEADERGFAS